MINEMLHNVIPAQAGIPFSVSPSDIAYTFHVRAVNSVGNGASATVIATPTDGGGTVTLCSVHIGAFAGGSVVADRMSTYRLQCVIGRYDGHAQRQDMLLWRRNVLF